MSEAKEYQQIRRAWKKRIADRQRRLSQVMWVKEKREPHPMQIKLLERLGIANPHPAICSIAECQKVALKLRHEISNLDVDLRMFSV